MTTQERIDELKGLLELDDVYVKHATDNFTDARAELNMVHERRLRHQSEMVALLKRAVDEAAEPPQ